MARRLAPLALRTVLATNSTQKPAHADLMFTNHSPSTSYVAIGRLDVRICDTHSQWRTMGAVCSGVQSHLSLAGADG